MVEACRNMSAQSYAEHLLPAFRSPKSAMATVDNSQPSPLP